TSRNIRHVYELEYNDNLGIIRSKQGTFFINMANINLIEEVEMMSKERLEEGWKDIGGYEGLYKINKFGEIKSLERKVKSSNGYRKKKERILKQTENDRGYKTIYLCKKGKCKQFSAHRLVATNFIREPLEKEVVNHID